MNYDEHRPLKDQSLNHMSIRICSFLDPKFDLEKQPAKMVFYTIFSMLLSLARKLDEK